MLHNGENLAMGHENGEKYPARGWHGLSPARRRAIIALATVQLGLAASAWTDLLRRPAGEVRGPKWRWALLIAVNFVGPISYFCFGRVRSTRDARP